MKNNIRIIIQGSTEMGADFAERLEQICEKLSQEFKETIFGTPKVTCMSAAGDGRQTATIQFLTKDKVESEPQLLL